MEVSINVRITATVKRDEGGEPMSAEELREELMSEVESVCDEIDCLGDYAIESTEVWPITVSTRKS